MTKKTTILTAAAILATEDALPRETVDVPEWGGSVIVQGFTAQQRDEWEESIQKRTTITTRRKGGKPKKRQGTRINYENFRTKLVVRCVVNEGGTRLFTDEDIPALCRKSAQAMSRLYDVAAQLCGITEEDEEELEGN